ncbi:MAG: pyrroline-5-carboxylate reductase [Proteobacteria bacterium]|nr:pyrroline-5-carboxylate reductase [Pseudomonadota bacterium]
MTTLGKIGFIGGGNMGSALVGGLLSHHFPVSDIIVSDNSPQVCELLQDKWGITTTTQSSDIVSTVDILVLAVKPQHMKTMLQEITTSFDVTRTLLISIAAGITTSQIKKWLGKDCMLVRAMPNTPALLGMGMTGLFAPKNLDNSHKQQAANLLSCVGETVWLENEEHMDIVTALSGSGPAYFFYLMEALINSATTLGLPKEIASLLTLQTALGSAKMAQKAYPNEDVAQLRSKVTSPGGTTQAGINVLKNGKLEELIENTLSAATQRGKELSQQYD